MDSTIFPYLFFALSIVFIVNFLCFDVRAVSDLILVICDNFDVE
jgi:hypothetical protein